jgi:hypothetical protein
MMVRGMNLPWGPLCLQGSWQQQQQQQSGQIVHLLYETTP